MSRAGHCPRCHLLCHPSCHPVPIATNPCHLPCSVPICTPSCPHCHFMSPKSSPVSTALVPTVTPYPHYIIPSPQCHPVPRITPCHFKSSLLHPHLQCHLLPSVTACPQCLLIPHSRSLLPVDPPSPLSVPSHPRATSFPCHLLSPVSRPITCQTPPRHLPLSHPAPLSFPVTCFPRHFPVSHPVPCHPCPPSAVPSPRPTAVWPRPINDVTRLAHARCARGSRARLRAGRGGSIRVLPGPGGAGGASPGGTARRRVSAGGGSPLGGRRTGTPPSAHTGGGDPLRAPLWGVGPLLVSCSVGKGPLSILPMRRSAGQGPSCSSALGRTLPLCLGL